MADEKKGKETKRLPAEKDTEAKVETTRGGAYVAPDVDICEEEERLALIADMPGVSAGGAEVKLEDGTLTISGRTRAEAPEVGPRYREYGPARSYHRAFSVSDDIDAEHIEARMKGGVLTVVLPKSARARPRRIEVKSA